uniref:Lipoprotein n=1 Tax=Desulfobacca acetoxidans TaxID=60893 RepID=A0A7V6A6Q6_9BACT
MTWLRQSRFHKLLALALILIMAGGCQVQPAQVGIPLAYGLTGTCLALLIYPTVAAGVVGFVVGCVLGAAVYNNSLKR